MTVTLAEKIEIAIVDDHPMVVEGLKTLLKKEKNIVTHSFTNGANLISFLQNNEVDVVLLDIVLPDVNGIEVCKEIKTMASRTVVLALSNQAERSIILQMLQNGASGYLLKNVSADELLQCIEEAQKGGIAFSKEVKAIMAKPSQYDLQAVPSLTKREKEILKMIAGGKTSQQIADTLFLSLFTVETHRRNLLHKAGVKNVAELIKIATDYRLL
ncbi:response regulator transcription factor [Niabella insulamsoli]|uniref:response regulator transcription factor n=1 Tax=Niabella insulamsoli TaxID=3144874 RepID=UPI0031FBBC16